MRERQRRRGAVPFKDSVTVRATRVWMVASARGPLAGRGDDLADHDDVGLAGELLDRRGGQALRRPGGRRSGQEAQEQKCHDAMAAGYGRENRTV